MSAPKKHERVEYEQVGKDYLEHRQLKKGAAGWVLLAGLGVAYVISGDFSGWNLGLDKGGFGGLLIAFVLMGLMYTCMVFGLAEMSSSMPVAGAGYGFARRALGPLGGYATGIAVLIEYAVAPAAISTFIAGYVQSLGLLEGVHPWPIMLACYLIFIGIHLWGVGEALKVMFGITAIAALALIIWMGGMVSKFDAAKLVDIEPTTAAGASAFLPFGYVGVLGALVYGIWFFLAVEGVPLAAEEASDPKKDMPRGIIAAIIILVIFGAGVLFLAPGTAGAAAMATSASPLVEAVTIAYGGPNFLSDFINWVGLLGLIASFFSIVYAYSRQLFALSRAGYLPRGLSVTGSRRTPYLALIVPGTIGFILAVTLYDAAAPGALLINIAVFGATVSYVLMNLSHIVLRRKEPNMERPYRTPGGAITTGIALALSAVAVVATFVVDILAAGITAIVFLAFIAYFWFYSRHRIVGGAPEEEFSAIAAAEADLK